MNELGKKAAHSNAGRLGSFERVELIVSALREGILRGPLRVLIAQGPVATDVFF